MKLSTLLRDLATLYRRYGDIPVLIETPNHIYEINRADEDIWNVNQQISVVIETEQVDSPTPEIPTRQKKRPRKTNSSSAA